MLKLALTVIAIALPDCINPSLIGGELFVAMGPRPRRRTAAFAAAAWTVTFLFGLAMGLGLGDLVLAFVPRPSARVKYDLIALAGAVLLVGGVVMLVRRRALAKSTSIDPGGPQGNAALLGAGVAGVELPTAFPYFAAITLIVGSNVSGASKLSLLVLYCLVYALPLIAIVVVCAVMGDRTERTLKPFSDWLSLHWPAVAGSVTCVIGIGVLGFGLIELRSL